MGEYILHRFVNITVKRRITEHSTLRHRIRADWYKWTSQNGTLPKGSCDPETSTRPTDTKQVCVGILRVHIFTCLSGSFYN